jgi:hypothetical protein
MPDEFSRQLLDECWQRGNSSFCLLCARSLVCCVQQFDCRSNLDSQEQSQRNQGNALSDDQQARHNQYKDMVCEYCNVSDPYGYYTTPSPNIKAKSLLGIPWRVAFALQDDGWILRQAIPWFKGNPMPESVTDRPNSAHEYVFLLTKKPRYFFDMEAVKVTAASDHNSGNGFAREERLSYQNGDGSARGNDEQWTDVGGMRHLRTSDLFAASLMTDDSGLIAFTVNTKGYSGAHFACWPPALVEPMIKAATSERGVCPVTGCGKPWVRVVEKSGPKHTGKTKSEYDNGSSANRLAMLRQAARESGEEYSNQTVTTGWRPTCQHNAEPIPAIVLDPFCGSGTTGEVCRQLGRRFVGIDLSAEYLGMLAMPRAERKNVSKSFSDLPLFDL